MLDPNLALAFNDRGNAYANKGQYDRAIQDYDQAIKLDPNLALAINNRAAAIAKLNK
jgi:tetratricopeptide (TPR) repeat protein